MAITYENGVVAGSTTNTSDWVFTHGLTIASGDLLVAMVQMNGDVAVAKPTAGPGAEWFDIEADYAGSSTSTYHISYSIANGSEGVQIGGTCDSTTKGIIVLQFKTDDGPFEVDATAVRNTGTSTAGVSSAITVANGAVAIAFVGVDSSTSTFSGPDNSYTNLKTYTPGRSVAASSRVFASAGSTSDTTTTINSSATFDSWHFSFKDAGTTGNIYINDAPTLNGNEVLQTYPGAANWSPTQIDMQTVPDITGLSPPYYLIVQRADGEYRAKEITLEMLASWPYHVQRQFIKQMETLLTR